MRPGPLLAHLCLSAATAACIGCGSSTTSPTQSHVPAAIRIVPDSTGLAPGSQFTFQARVTDAGGAAVSATVLWSVDDTSIASIDSTGRARAKETGRTRVVARTGSLSDDAVLRVEAGAVATAFVNLYPQAATYLTGDLQPYLPETIDGQGHFVFLNLTWSVSDTSVASVDSTGIVYCKRPGTVQVSAISGLSRGDASLTVVKGPTVSTLLGSPEGVPGYQDGVAAQTLLDAPFGLAQDSLGSLYIAEVYGNRIRVLENGTLRTLAGSGEPGNADGVGTQATFNAPTAVAIGPGRRLYVADQANNFIRVITPDGRVTTLAGGAGYQDGSLDVARFNHPGGIAVDDSGNIFVADKDNHVIRVITRDDTVRTLCGTPGVSGHEDGVPGMLDHPSALIVGPNHTLYLCDLGSEGSSVRKVGYDPVAPRQQAILSVGGGGLAGYSNGPAPHVLFNQPYGVAVGPDGWVYVSDSRNRVIRAIAPQGQGFTLAGTGVNGVADGPSEASTWDYPGWMLFSGGDLLVSDLLGNKVRRIHGVLHTQAAFIPDRVVREAALRGGPKPAHRPVRSYQPDPTLLRPGVMP